MAGGNLALVRALRIIEMTAGFMPPMPGLLAACTMLEPGFRDRERKVNSFRYEQSKAMVPLSP
jgi:hypothetical protein